MILLVAATEMEAAPLRARGVGEGNALLLSGVGLLETAVRLGRRLCEEGESISLVLNFGVAGAYPGSGAGLLDLCLAAEEVLGDFGICQGETTLPFPPHLGGQTIFPLSPAPIALAVESLSRHGLAVRKGTFLTVQGASATTSRGVSLRKTHQALCENMEGAAVARLCAELSLPCLELRAVSNLVEERNPAAWRLEEASERCAAAVAVLIAEFSGQGAWVRP